jgi:AcrR family transcriptional regulator
MPIATGLRGPNAEPGLRGPNAEAGVAGEVTPKSIAEVIDDLTAEIATHRHGRVPADLRRAHILAIAFGLFAERSFYDVSMDEIAARAGVSKPVVYGLVGDKERIFRSCVELATFALGEQVSAAMRAEADVEAALRAGARAFFEFVQEAGPGWDRLLVTQGGPVSVELDAARRRQAELVAELLGEIFERHAERAPGEPIDRLQIEAIAHSMNGACESLAAWWRRHPELALDDLVELATRLVAPGVTGVIERPLGAWALTGPTQGEEP